MRWCRAAVLACGVLSAAAPLCADEIKTSPVSSPTASADQAQASARQHESPDAPPLGTPGWHELDPTTANRKPDRSPSENDAPGRSWLLPILALFGFILVAGILLGRSLRRWRPRDIEKYLERTGGPWGRREDLFVEKLVLELRVLRAGELTKNLALRERFDELDRVERPIRKLRARYRAVRREYSHIARRIGPVSNTVRHDCARAIRQSGLVQAAVLSPQETEAIRRLSLSIERKKRAMQPAS